MKVFFAAEHASHDPAAEVQFGVSVPNPDTPARAEAIHAALRADPAFHIEAPQRYGRDAIEAVHDPAMVAFLEHAWDAFTGEIADEPVRPTEAIPDTILHARLREGMEPLAPPARALAGLGHWCFETMTPIGPRTFAAAIAAVDVAVSAADAVLAGEPVAYGLCRPPGHHAARAVFGGYCYFNNAAIAAEHLLRAQRGRVAILDIDLHHGNGTQQIFYGRADVLYASVHADPAFAYPYYTGFATERGAGDGAGTTLNLPLQRGTEDPAWLAALDTALDAVVRFAPVSLVVSLGVDGHRDDPLTEFALTDDAYWHAGTRVGATGLPAVVLQEGGYRVESLGRLVATFLAGVAETVRSAPSR